MILKNSTKAFTFIIGAVVGFLIFLFLSKSDRAISVRLKVSSYLDKIIQDRRYTPQEITHLSFPIKSELISSPTTETVWQINPKISSNSLNLEQESLNNVDGLFKSVRVLCWVITNPKNHKTKAIHIKKTWGSRCNKLVFMSTAKDENLEVEVLDVKEGYWTLWGKTRKSIQLLYKKYLEEADWFFKVDDDTYAIMDNLRLFLKDYDSNQTHYFGCHFFQSKKNVSYMSGGAGYVLSKETIKRVVENGFTNKMKCSPRDVGYEDIELGRCLRNVGIEGDDSRDEKGRFRFISLAPKSLLGPGTLKKDFWWWKYIKYRQEKGKNCCSPSIISFHYVAPHEMYVYDFLLYQVKPALVDDPATTTASSTIDRFLRLF